MAGLHIQEAGRVVAFHLSWRSGDRRTVTPLALLITNSISLGWKAMSGAANIRRRRRPMQIDRERLALIVARAALAETGGDV